MLRNYCKIAVRTLLKHKVFSLINIAGLAISMAVCLLIILYIAHEKSYDRFHAKADRIYRVYSEYKAGVNAASDLYATAPVQLALSLLFVVTVLVQHGQLRYMREADYGFRYHNIINVRLQDASYEVFRQQVERHPGVAQVSVVSDLPMAGGRSDRWMRAPGAEEARKIYFVRVDHDFIDNLAIELVAGRGFSREFPADRERTVILNQTALRELGWRAADGALGESLAWGGDRRVDRGHMQVIGVVEDFHAANLAQPIYPIALVYDPNYFAYANVRVHDGQLAAVSDHIEALWSKLGSVHPVDSTAYAALIEEGLLEFRDSFYMIGLVAGCAVVIACLGLLGIAIYSAERRVKEVGIRKVFGAGAAGVVGLLLRDFAWLVGVATALAVPAAWLLNDQLLRAFAYRIEVDGWSLVSGAAAILALALLAVGSQALRAAWADPVETMRYE